MKHLNFFGCAAVAAMLVSVASCNKEEIPAEGAYIIQECLEDPVANPVIEIKANRTYGNELTAVEDNAELTKASGPNTVTVYDQMAIAVPRALYVGQLFSRSGVISGTYANIRYQGDSYSIVSDLPGVSVKEMNIPTYSKYLSNISSMIEEADSIPTGEVQFTMGQFASYDELKSVVGANVNIGELFKKNNANGGSGTIDSATGIYLKVFQPSFTVSMISPVSCYDFMDINDKSDALYLNSVTYGRMGLVVLETDYTASASYKNITKIVRKFFKEKTTSLTIEEEQFLERSTILICAAGTPFPIKLDLESFLSGFSNAGDFTKANPGVPIFYSFNNVKDNTRFGFDFHMTVSYDPVYVRLEEKNARTENYLNNENSFCRTGDIYVSFFRDPAGKYPIIAYPQISFGIKEEEFTEHFSPKRFTSTKSKNYYFKNTARNCSSLWRDDAVESIIWRDGSDPDRPSPVLMAPVVDTRGSYDKYYTYSLLPSTEYTVIGSPISGMEREVLHF